MNWGAGLVLTPLGGLLATFGLNVPFIVSMAGSLTGLAFSLLFMKDVHDIKPLSAKAAGAAKVAPPAASDGFRSPWADPILLMLASSYGLFGTAMSLQALMLPTLLQAESFGLGDERAVAKTLG